MNLLERSTSFCPVIGGNTISQAIPIPRNTLPKLSTTFVKPSIIAERPPCSFQNLSIAFRASVEGCIILLKPSLIEVNSVAASSLSPIICSHEVAHPDWTDSFIVSSNCVNVFTSVAALTRLSSSANLVKVLINTSSVNHPSCNVSLNGLDLSTNIPISLAVSFNAFWNNSPPIPALTTEFQSIRLTLPAAKA